MVTINEMVYDFYRGTKGKEVRSGPGVAYTQVPSRSNVD